MRHSGRGWWLPCALALFGCGCASARPADLKARREQAAAAQREDAGDPDEQAPAFVGPPVVIEDSALGLRYELPALEEGWQIPREGRGARRGNGVQVEVGSFPLPREATGSACRDSARAKLAAGDKAAKPKPPADGGAQEPPNNNKDALREQALGDWPTATWSFTRGPEDAPMRSRWAFFPRGSDCLLLEVSGPRDARFPDVAFQTGARTFKALPLPAERQREVDLMAGMSFLERRDAASALERFEVLSNREPDFAKAHFGALMAGFELGPPAYVRALPHGVAALRAERDLSAEQRQIALRAVGVMQLAENQIKAAARTLAELVVRAPELAEGQYNYACALARLGDKDSAIDHLRQAVRIDRDLVKHAQEDDDLKGLRDDEKFQRLLKEPPAGAARRPRVEIAPETQPADDEE